jgi:hypothetical protein
MTATVRFLERLNPAARAGEASSAVRASLPSRFAPPAIEPETPASAIDEGDSNAPARDASTKRRDGRVSGERASVEHRRAIDVDSSGETSSDTVRTTAELMPVTPKPVAARPSPPLERKTIAPRDTMETPTPTPSHASPSHRAAPKSTVVAAREDSRASSTSPILRPESVASTASARPPLREQVRERRLGAPPAPTPTIVQVTIDRIDVRAAAAAATASDRATPRARPAAWTSLGDYLRQGDRGAGGTS